MEDAEARRRGTEEDISVALGALGERNASRCSSATSVHAGRPGGIDCPTRMTEAPPQLDGVRVEVIERFERLDVAAQLVDDAVDRSGITNEMSSFHPVAEQRLASRNSLQSLCRRPVRCVGVAAGQLELGESVSGVGDGGFRLGDDRFGERPLAAADPLEHLAAQQADRVSQQVCFDRAVVG